MATKSGRYWVSWANTNAKNSNSIEDLEPGFRACAQAFIQALTEAGAEVTVCATRRCGKRAYLFHWSWKISQDLCAPSEAEPMEGVSIRWDHGDLAQSAAGALEMVRGFGLAMPPRCVNSPSLTSNHITGQAIDMTINWQGTLKVRTKNGDEAAVPYLEDVNQNTLLHAVGESYGAIKLVTDAPHWSYNGR
ncbi:MAG: hypothetical protein HC848_09815 [Limnobacter sp.]|nr:hypothetical protein [Limnobacter sp.]